MLTLSIADELVSGGNRADLRSKPELFSRFERRLPVFRLGLKVDFIDARDQSLRIPTPEVSMSC